MTLASPTWRLLDSDIKQVKQMATRMNLPEPICTILHQRGLEEVREIHQFLYPKLERLPSPVLLKGLEPAVQIILAAQNNGQDVVIYGDYDVDGVTSTALLFSFLKQIEVQVSFYHPDRLDDGYGLSKSIVDTIVRQHPYCVIITVDCGISDHESVDYAKSKGLTVIVTDHHLPPENLPAADVIINPLQKGCSFPFKYLAGVGLAFYLIVGIRSKLREEGHWTHETQPNIKELLDFVAIGSVADMVPLVDVNRILVKAGLDAINSRKQQRQGLAGLFALCNMANKQITVEDIGFQLAPRINAAGRLGSARLATQLLTSDDPGEVYILAEKLNIVNEERKRMAKVQTEQALDMAQRQICLGKDAVILHHDDWHHGLIGIIASRVCESTQKPTIILAGSPIAKGSARTTSSCDIFKLLHYCSNSLEQFGGHKRAAGLTLKISKIQQFISLAEEYIQKEAIHNQENEVVVDAILPTNGDSGPFYENYKLLEPFGTDNPEPKFMLDEPCYLRNIRVVGKKKDHLRFTTNVYGKSLTGIGFGFGHLAKELTENKTNIVFSISENWFKGRKSWQAVLHCVYLAL